MQIRKSVAALGLALSIASPAIAQDASPVGTWQTTTGESRYAVSLCGDGTQLCAKLTWLRKDARTPENLQLLNHYVLRGALPIAANKWRGMVKYDGQTVTGSVTLVSETRLRLSGCQFIACTSVEFEKL